MTLSHTYLAYHHNRDTRPLSHDPHDPRLTRRAAPHKPTRPPVFPTLPAYCPLPPPVAGVDAAGRPGGSISAGASSRSSSAPSISWEGTGA